MLTPQFNESLINVDPLRFKLETSLIKARWVASLGLLILIISGQFRLPEAIIVPLSLVVGNFFVITWLNRSRSINSQRVLGFTATLIDSFIALLVILVSPAALDPSIYAILILVAAEAAVRYAPLKGFLLSLILSAGLAMIMSIRQSHEEAGSFNWGLLLFWGSLIVGIGLVFGTIIREIYRQRAIPQSVKQMVSSADMELLTPREVDVYKLISNGYSNQQIADELVIEIKTVKNHINSMYSKLNMDNRYQAISRSLSTQQHKEDQSIQPDTDNLS